MSVLQKKVLKTGFAVLDWIRKKVKEMEYDKTIPKCPICKSTAFIAHDFVCGYDFGFSIGCPRACIADGIHGFDDYDSFHQAKLVFNALPTKEIAKKCWEERCKERGEAE